MAKIKINNAKYSCIVGINEEEKSIRRDIFIDLELKYDIIQSVVTDNLEYTIDYRTVNEIVKNLIENKSYCLIETMAEDIIYNITSKFKVDYIKINLRKPTGIKNADSSEIEIERELNEVYIALGSNIGDKEKNMNKAIDLILRKSKLIAKSSLLYNPPAFYKDQDEFVNAVICVETYLNPRELLNFLLSIETDALNRERLIKNGPRSIDLDIIFFGNKVINEDGLRIPHPHMHERFFVLKPMKEIASEFVHPTLNKTIDELFLLESNPKQ